MTSMAAYALSQQGRLGEAFCQYASPKGSKELLPTPADSIRPWNPVALCRKLLGGFPATDMKATAFLEFLQRDSMATRVSKDYLLMAYMLDGDLDAFAKGLLTVYPPLDTLTLQYTPADSLPRNFQEALTQYQMTTEVPLTSLQDSAMMAEYQRYDSLKHRLSVPSQQWEEFQKAYRGTYWNY